MPSPYLSGMATPKRASTLSPSARATHQNQRSASLMTTQLKGKTGAEAQKLYDEFHHIVTTGEAPTEISDLAAFAGVHTFPARIKCATLGWHAALNALKGDPLPATTETHKD